MDDELTRDLLREVEAYHRISLEQPLSEEQLAKLSHLTTALARIAMRELHEGQPGKDRRVPPPRPRNRP